MAKRLTKYFLIFFWLIMLTISFCGCASVRAMTITNEDGSIEEQVYVSLDQTAIEDKQMSISEIKQDISDCAVSEGQSMINKLENMIFMDQLSATAETRQILESFKNGIVVLSNNWQGNDYVVSVKFKNIDVYKYYYGITETASVESTTEEHFFYDKVSFAGSTMYLKHYDLYNRLKAVFSVKYANLINSESNELLYTYTTELKRQHSNADYVSYVDGKYYHTWVVEDVETEEILFHYNIANAGNWIIVCIGVSVVACGIMFAISYFINRKKIKK